jgi:hypothetical protein
LVQVRGSDVPLADPIQRIWDLRDLVGADRIDAAGRLRQWLLDPLTRLTLGAASVTHDLGYVAFSDLHGRSETLPQIAASSPATSARSGK